MSKKKSDEVMGRIETKLDLFKDQFDLHSANVHAKFEKIDEKADVTNIILGKQQVILDEHVKRTNILEKKLADDRAEIESKIDPIREHVSQMKFILKVVGALAGASGAGLGIKEILSLFGN